MESLDQRYFLARIYESKSEDSKSDLANMAAQGAAHLAKKAIWFWKNQSNLHEEGVHKMLIRMGAARDLSDAASKAVKYLSNLTVRYSENLTLRVTRSGNNAYLFTKVPC